MVQHEFSKGTRPRLEVDGVSKLYVRRGWRTLVGRAAPTQTLALDNISFCVPPGETLGLLGPNGAGKTTMLKILTGLLYPTSGSVKIDGRDMHLERRMVRGLMGLVTCDERSFYWRLSGRRNLRFFATLYGLSRDVAEHRIDELLDALGLTYAADRPYSGYSSGMKQKLAIARGLLSNPRIILYDEPTRSLDPVSAMTIRQWIADRRATNPEQTHILATNLLDEAELLCDRVVILNRGRIAAQGPIREIQERFNERDYEDHVITYRGGPISGDWLRGNPPSGLLEAKEGGTGVRGEILRVRTLRNSDAFSMVLARLLEEGATIVECSRTEVAFDEVFCSLVLSDNRTAETVLSESVSP